MSAWSGLWAEFCVRGSCTKLAHMYAVAKSGTSLHFNVFISACEPLNSFRILSTLESGPLALDLFNGSNFNIQPRAHTAGKPVHGEYAQ
jgi:hypothetical protein